jgi:hypothetical protein
MRKERRRKKIEKIERVVDSKETRWGQSAVYQLPEIENNR